MGDVAMDPSAVHDHLGRRTCRRRSARLSGRICRAGSTTSSTRGRPTTRSRTTTWSGPTATATGTRERRLAELEADGVVAEVLFPNTVPPFFPQASLTVQPPARSPRDAELRWAGLRAHNRWLVDFCAAAPGRRAGIAQISLHDIDGRRRRDPVGEGGRAHRRRAAPGRAARDSACRSCTTAYYEPLWQVCEELGVPVNHHGGSASPPIDGHERRARSSSCSRSRGSRTARCAT